MAKVPVDKQKINPFVLERLPNPVDVPLPLLAETDPGYAREVANRLSSLTGLKITGEISWGKFIPILCPPSLIQTVQRIPHVRRVHGELPAGVFLFPPLPTIPVPSFEHIHGLIGRYQVSPVEIPRIPISRVMRGLGVSLAGPLGVLAAGKPDVKIFGTGSTREILGVPKDRKVDVKVAVLDTGSPVPFHPLRKFRHMVEMSSVPEGPQDLMSHGVWCTTCAFMGEHETNYGVVESIAEAKNLLHVKVLTATGFGSTSTVLKGMEMAYKWGAKVVSMSLGTPLQGGVGMDPVCQIVQQTGDEVMWICAAGNEGPSNWTIGSPGAAPKALTVAAGAIPETDQIAWYSSRGPSGQFYKDHQDQWRTDLSIYGQALVKPDIYAPGGGRPLAGAMPDTPIYSGGQGWADLFCDPVPGTGFSAMKGTSMATPHVAGLAALLWERKNIKTTQQFKSKMGRSKDIGKGMGMPRYDRF